MSFLDQYLDKHVLDQISDQAKTVLDKVESDLEKQLNIPPNMTFEDCISKFGPQIADIVERFVDHIKNLPAWSLKSVADNLRFVFNIAVEVYHVIVDMRDCVVDPNASVEDKHKAEVQFGKNLVWFIWNTVGPLNGKLDWIPLKKTIEKNLVFWIAGMAIQSAMDLVEANTKPKLGKKGKEEVPHLRAF